VERQRGPGPACTCWLSFLILASRADISAFNARARLVMGSAFFLKSPMDIG
jgi:hypothetical protein